MGKIIAGVVRRGFETDVGQAYVLELVKPVELDGKVEPMVSIGAMKGFQMAIQAAGFTGLLVGDKVVLEATGTEPATQAGHSPMVKFSIEITRAGKVYRGKTEDAGAPFLSASFWGV